MRCLLKENHIYIHARQAGAACAIHTRPDVRQIKRQIEELRETDKEMRLIISKKKLITMEMESREKMGVGVN